MICTPQEAAQDLLARKAARRSLLEYIKFTTPRYKVSTFNEVVCAKLDKFILDVNAGLRPILILQAPPQHGKSEMVSRKLPAYLMGKFREKRIAAASYADELANAMAQDVRRNLASPDHQQLFRSPDTKGKFDVNRMGEFTTPGGTGSYLGVGVGAGLTGRPVDIGIIDDPVKNEKEALSATTKEGHWNWYQSVFTTRLSEFSGQIIMATSWAEDDLPGRIGDLYKGNPRLTHLRFPAINEPGEVGFNPDMPLGALVPELHSLEKLLEDKAGKSDYWWSAMYQQSPKALGGNVFKDYGVQYYYPKDLPERFDVVVDSWDCTFKDTDGTDFVVGQVWGKLGARAWLLYQTRARLSFSNTVAGIRSHRAKFPMIRETLIEDKANGPAVIDHLKHEVSGLIPIEPDGSKLARAHAVTSYWEAHNIFLPHPDTAPDDDIARVLGSKWVQVLVNELTTFPAAAHDDQVDSLSQALRRLFSSLGALRIPKGALARVKGRV